MIDFMAMTVIGGMGVFGGPVVGVVVVLGLSEFLRGFESIRLLVWGVLLLVIILFFPNGISGSDVQVRLLREKVDEFRSVLGGDRE
jgi:ABC-type branched-subunit amino acid transport system permease subunit